MQVWYLLLPRLNIPRFLDRDLSNRAKKIPNLAPLPSIKKPSS